VHIRRGIRAPITPLDRDPCHSPLDRFHTIKDESSERQEFWCVFIAADDSGHLVNLICTFPAPLIPIRPPPPPPVSSSAAPGNGQQQDAAATSSSKKLLVSLDNGCIHISLWCYQLQGRNEPVQTAAEADAEADLCPCGRSEKGCATPETASAQVRPQATGQWSPLTSEKKLLKMSLRNFRC
jgi:hypothetical protein